MRDKEYTPFRFLKHSDYKSHAINNWTETIGVNQTHPSQTGMAISLLYNGKSIKLFIRENYF
jgi:hypothetical protein